MQRVLIIGCPGSGKSTLATALAARCRLPLFHLDQLYWQPGWTKPDEAVWRASLSSLLSQERWILDGNYGSTLSIRATAADTIIFLDLPRGLCLWRILRRTVFWWNQNRADMPKGCPEHLDLDFLRFVWRFPRDSRPQILRDLSEHPEKVVTLSSPHAIKRFLQRAGQTI